MAGRSYLRKTSDPLPESKPLLGDTGNVEVDAVLDVVNQTAEAWTATPPPDQGVAGVIAAGIGAGLQTFGAPVEMLESHRGPCRDDARAAGGHDLADDDGPDDPPCSRPPADVRGSRAGSGPVGVRW